MPDHETPIPSKPDPPCPVCGRKAVVEFRPFCSRRCAAVDLGRWLTGGYSLPGPDADKEEETGGET